MAHTDSVPLFAPGITIRLDLVALFFFGVTASLMEISHRDELDLPVVEGILVVWALGELLSRKLRIETRRSLALYALGTYCALLVVWIVVADSMNGQAASTTIRNVLKYIILFLMVTWIAFSPSKRRIAILLFGSLIGSVVIGYYVLASNPDTPYLAKYHTPYVGLMLLAAWSSGRPFDRGWRWVTSAAALAVMVLAVNASARWALVSGAVVLTANLLPRFSLGAFRVSVVVVCIAPLVPLLLLDSAIALQLIAERDLRSAADVERVALYAFAHDTIMRFPIFGIGFENFVGRFESSFGHVLTMTSSVQGPHNQYAAIGSIFGVPALLMYVAAVTASVFMLRPAVTRSRRLAQACVALWGFMYLANEISDDARLQLYLLATLIACGEPVTRSWFGSLLPRRHQCSTRTCVQPA